MATFFPRSIVKEPLKKIVLFFRYIHFNIFGDTDMKVIKAIPQIPPNIIFGRDVEFKFQIPRLLLVQSHRFRWGIYAKRHFFGVDTMVLMFSGLSFFVKSKNKTKNFWF
jgi:hypothetical protein